MRKFKKNSIVAHINKVSDQTPTKTQVDTEDWKLPGQWSQDDVCHHIK